MPIASSSLNSLSKKLWGKILSTNSTDLDALGDSIDQTTRGMPPAVGGLLKYDDWLAYNLKNFQPGPIKTK